MVFREWSLTIRGGGGGGGGGGGWGGVGKFLGRSAIFWAPFGEG